MNHLLPEMLIENFPITLHCKDLLTTQANLKLLVSVQIPPPSSFLLDQLSVPVPHKERLEEGAIQHNNELSNRQEPRVLLIL